MDLGLACFYNPEIYICYRMSMEAYVLPYSRCQAIVCWALRCCWLSRGLTFTPLCSGFAWFLRGCFPSIPNWPTWSWRFFWFIVSYCYFYKCVLKSVHGTLQAVAYGLETQEAFLAFLGDTEGFSPWPSSPLQTCQGKMCYIKKWPWPFFICMAGLTV